MGQLAPAGRCCKYHLTLQILFSMTATEKGLFFFYIYILFYQRTVMLKYLWRLDYLFDVIWIY